MARSAPTQAGFRGNRDGEFVPQIWCKESKTLAFHLAVILNLTIQ